MRGRHNLYNHLDYLLNKAERSVLVSTTEQEFIYLVKVFKPVFEKLKKKQINIKTKKHALGIRKFAEVKHTDNKARFCIVDGKEIVFMVMDDNEVHPTYDVGKHTIC